MSPRCGRGCRENAMRSRLPTALAHDIGPRPQRDRPGYGGHLSDGPVE